MFQKSALSAAVVMLLTTPLPSYARDYKLNLYHDFENWSVNYMSGGKHTTCFIGHNSARVGISTWLDEADLVFKIPALTAKPNKRGKVDVEMAVQYMADPVIYRDVEWSPAEKGLILIILPKRAMVVFAVSSEVRITSGLKTWTFPAGFSDNVLQAYVDCVREKVR